MLAVGSRNVHMAPGLRGSDAVAGTDITKYFTLGHSETATMVVLDS
jgi:hypothetical protein